MDVQRIKKLKEAAKCVLAMPEPAAPQVTVNYVQDQCCYQAQIIDRDRARLVMELTQYYEDQIQGILNPVMSATAAAILQQQGKRYKQILKDERKRVLDALREWAKQEVLSGLNGWDLLDKLDSMESDKEE